ncbi:MAG: sigma-54-dependent Fis family transcriptional regulator, partial [Burkholderiales bacterium]|nr:sigma-54-dependent Fis family transcriptional regulator [Burkholderiales bacterium]
EAGEGTLFLDEIGELPLELQAKLLRVLENGEYQRVGETQSRTSRARVIAATNRDLRLETREGRFRLDLYHRLSVFTIQVPPLRDLGEDKQLLLDHFADLYARQIAARPFQLAPEATVLWRAYPFPGNVRELRNIVIRLVTKYAGGLVGREQLAAELDFDGDLQPALASATMIDPFVPSAAAARRLLQETTEFDLDGRLRAWELAFVEAALDITHGNLSQAARLLGMHRTTLYSRMQSLGAAPESGVKARFAPQ